MKVTAIIPRSFHNWKLNLGARNRVRIQAWQYAKHAVRTANFIGRSASLDKVISGLEHRIVNVTDTGFKALALSFPIMLIDDSALLLGGIEKHLNKLGFYNIIKHTNPLEAIKAFKTMPEKPRLVITDQSMPELQGTELIKRLAAASEKSPPRFILFSGDPNLSEAGNPAAWVLKEHRVFYIQKGVDTGLFTLSVLEAATEVARGVAPAVKTLLIKDPVPTVTELIHNPIYQFAGRIVHKTNNLLAAISVLIPMAIEEGTLAEDQADLMESAAELSSFADQLAVFARTKDFNRPLGDNTALPKALAEDPRSQDYWELILPDQRYKFAIIADQYLQNGLLHFKREITEIMEMLFTPDAPPDLAAVSAKLARSVGEINRLNNAVRQRTPEDPIAQLFANYYRLLENL